MRVIAGLYKGRPLETVSGLGTRPTTDRVKEALFSILHPHLQDASFLDLFAGSGQIGMEAFSRGASEVVFVEEDPRVTKVIKKNLATLGLTAEVYTKDVFFALTVFSKKNRAFDLIFCDPPYDRGLSPHVLSFLGEKGLVAKEGLVIFEHGRKEEIPREVWNLLQVRQIRYGDTILSFYRLKEDIE